MSKIVNFPDYDRIEETACDWIARLDARELTADELAELHTWLNSDYRHQQVLLEMATALDQMSVVAVLRRLVPLDEVDMTSRRPTRQQGIAVMLGLGMAAAALLLITVFLPGIPAPEKPAYVTKVGEVIDITTLDGSVITLNTDSRMSLDFSSSYRRVVLQRGEAMFQVAKDADRPFIVVAADSEIRAVGTAFNVDMASRRLEVTVTEGIIEVLPTITKKGQTRNADNLVSVTNLQRVNAGEAIYISDELIDTYPIDAETVTTRLSWQRGELIFQGEPLEEVISEVGRYSQAKLVIADDTIRKTPVGGVFRTGDVDNLLDVLDLGFNISATRSNGVIYLSSKSIVGHP